MVPNGVVGAALSADEDAPTERGYSARFKGVSSTAHNPPAIREFRGGAGAFSGRPIPQDAPSLRGRSQRRAVRDRAPSAGRERSQLVPRLKSLQEQQRCIASKANAQRHALRRSTISAGPAPQRHSTAVAALWPRRSARHRGVWCRSVDGPVSRRSSMTGASPRAQLCSSTDIGGKKYNKRLGERVA